VDKNFPLYRQIKMSERSVGFKLVKYIYIVLLVLGLFSSAVLFVVGLCALTDNGENRHIYENFMKYYGIDELDFQPVFNKTHYLNRFNFDEDNYDKQSFFGTFMVFVGLISILFETIALIGAIKENIMITTTILILMVMGTVSSLCTINRIDACTLVTQLLFIILAALYVILLKKELNQRRSHLYTTDVEMNNNLNKGFSNQAFKSETMEKYVSINGAPPPYKNDI
jgi:hypothetical protein